MNANATPNLSDTSTWLPLEGLAPGFDANKVDPTQDLAGRTISLTTGDGTRISHRFTADSVSWEFQPGQGATGPEAGAGEDEYEAIKVADGLYWVQFQHVARPEEAVSLCLDLTHGRALAVIATIREPGPGRTAVGHQFLPATIDGAEVTGAAPAPTIALIGRRVMWEYSPVHVYEHLYLSPQWYTWQCLAGPERGLADTDENTAYELRRGIYVFAWREKVIPCASVTVADHRDVTAIRSHGVLFGLNEAETEKVHFTFGAHGRLLSTTVHPEAFDPARADAR